MSRKRKIVYGANSIILAIVLLGLFIGFGYFVTAYNRSFDFTEEKLFSLDPHTREFLVNLDRKVSVIGFFQKNSPPAQLFLDMMKRYGEHSKKIEYELIDPDEDPGAARTHGISRLGTIIATAGQNTKRTYELTEESITNLLIMVTREKKKKIFITSGHGERDISSQEPMGMFVVADDLRKQGFEVVQGNILESYDEWDEDTLVIVPGVKKPFLSEEVDVLKNFIKDGGNVIALIDPDEKEWFESLFGEFGIRYLDGLIIDPSSRIFGGTPVMALVTWFASHPSLENFKLATFMAIAGGLEVSRKKGVNPIVLCRTGRGAWLESDERAKVVRFDPGKDRSGPVAVAALSVIPAGERSSERNEKGEKEGVVSREKVVGETTRPGDAKGEGRLLVVADSDFVSNHYAGFSGNEDLFLNFTKWMLSEEKILNIKPKRPKTSNFYMTPAMKKAWFAGAVVALPLFIFGAGYATWRTRRRR